jgi:solute carrier family 25 citrate transporter 1
MPRRNGNGNGNGNGKSPPSAATNLIAGGGAGMMEALACHPLDTIKVRMQLSRRARQPGARPRGFIQTGASIVRKETPMALYKGLGAVLTGIIPKMAIRFTSFEAYKQLLANQETGAVSGRATFLGAPPHLLQTHIRCVFADGKQLALPPA